MTSSTPLNDDRGREAAPTPSRGSDSDRFFDLAQDLLAMIDASEVMVRVNAAWSRVLGYAPEELIGRPFRVVVHPDDLACSVEDYRKVVRGLPSDRFENRLVARDGSVRWIQWSAVYHADQGLVFSAGRDVTPRRRAYEALRRNRERIQLVLRNLGLCVFTGRAEGDFATTWVSENVLRITGFPPETFTSKPGFWLTRLYPDDRERVMHDFARLPELGEVSYEYRWRCGDGEYHWFSDSAVLVRDHHGRPLEVVGTWHDVTERKQLEAQLRQSQKMDELGRLAGGVAHDFNNLLTAIQGYGELLRAYMVPTDDRLEFVDEILHAGECAAALSRQLLTFSRREMVERRLVDLNQVVADMERMLRRTIGEDVRLVTSLSDGLERVWGDVGQMEQVVLNLAVNARDAMPDGGQISISTSNVSVPEVSADPTAPAPGSYVVLTVADNGCGMDEALRERIFEPFFTTKGRGKGTGLGLSTVFGIALQAGGAVTVESAVGEGTTFRVYVPAAVGARAEAAEAAQDGAWPGGCETVLLVEDDDRVRGLARRVLHDCGYSVLEARSGEDALAVFHQQHAVIDLVVTDIVMPGMNGRQFAEVAHVLRPDMPILYVSGYADEEVLRQGLEIQRASFLRKPFTPEALTRRVREMLGAPVSLDDARSASAEHGLERPA